LHIIELATEIRSKTGVTNAAASIIAKFAIELQKNASEVQYYFRNEDAVKLAEFAELSKVTYGDNFNLEATVGLMHKTILLPFFPLEGQPKATELFYKHFHFTSILEPQLCGECGKDKTKA
jgi:hypothetical protein